MFLRKFSIIYLLKTTLSKYSKDIIHKNYIISKMETNFKPEQEQLKKLLEELNLTESNLPEVPKKENRITRYYFLLY